jgi:hypothetical protein
LELLGRPESFSKQSVTAVQSSQGINRNLRLDNIIQSIIKVLIKLRLLCILAKSVCDQIIAQQEPAAWLLRCSGVWNICCERRQDCTHDLQLVVNRELHV